ncbi:hypothetical protein SBA5_60032 [Candidatus Sulfotelmatomonas gaucii]|uniref:Uncharacterized protein n=1 Tax=Candidatus Sulfuritelmatomonas gaucii TaxID=2043161 RepID=A0A2N9LWR2_9BACT|nr:hypothetical protein SBA5_60032 [Candidatus Sulfotelmatomonas gaucii]
MRHPVELAEKILALLEHEDFRDAVKALKIATILLPLPLSSLSVPSETAQVLEESAVEVR